MKQIYLLSALFFISVWASAQYCGNSGPSVCTPVSDVTAEPGIRPSSTDLAPLINGDSIDVVLQFKNFTSFTFSGQTVTVISVKFDSINNLPSGICWATNKANNTFTTGEEGCIRITGNLNDLPGQYKLWVVVTPYLGVPMIGDGTGTLPYFVRVKNAGDNDIPVDTNQTNQNPFISYDNWHVGMNEVQNLGVTVLPNPSTSHFTICAPGINTNAYFNMYDAYGRLVKQEILTSSNTTIQRGALPNGIYFWQVSSNEKVLSSGKLVLE